MPGVTMMLYRDTNDDNSVTLGVDELYSTGAGQESNPELNGDDNDNGITTQPSGEIRSNVVTLTPADEPNVNSACGTTQNPTADFGIWRPASLGNYVWIDADRDGVQNKPALSGLNGVTVTLYLQQPDESWSQLAVTQTANNPVGSNPGFYSFTHLIQGRYYVEFTLPNGYTWTTQTGSVDPANPASITHAHLSSEGARGQADTIALR